MFSNKRFDFSYKEGRFSVALDGVTMFADASAEYKLGERMISSAEHSEYSLNKESVSDERGNGIRITATLKNNGLPSMEQHFTFYDNEKYFLIGTKLVSEEDDVASNYIAPLVVRNGNIQNGNPKWTNFLEVPFDNDAWVTFETKKYVSKWIEP